jgi:hypothetical protein
MWVVWTKDEKEQFRRASKVEAKKLRNSDTKKNIQGDKPSFFLGCLFSDTV